VTQAIVAGSYANGIGLYNNAFLVDAVVGVLTVEMVTIPSGGADEESNFEYMNRLSDRASLLTPVPILAADYALLAMDISGVGRSLGIDGYNPGDDTYNNERYVTVAIADVNGAATSSILKSEVQAYLESFREVNFEVRVMDPTYTVINVVVNLTRLDNADSTLVVLAVEQALAEYLNPASWGSPARDGADPGDTRNWRQVTKVRYLEVAQIINNVSGVDYINTLTVNGGTADITLTGDAPLPSASSTYTVTVVSP
jgi:hypothetical protein